MASFQVSVKEESEVSKPALPPKPAMPIKPTPPPPPRQSHNSVEVTTAEPPETGLTVLRAPPTNNNQSTYVFQSQLLGLITKISYLLIKIPIKIVQVYNAKCRA